MSVATPVVETWDGANRRIILKQGVTEFHFVTDIYTEYRNQRRLDENLRKFEPLVEARGYESKGAGKFTSRFLVLLTDGNGLTTKVVPYDEAGEITALGEAITDVADTDPSLFDITGITNPVIINYTPPDTELVEVGLSEQDIQDLTDEIIDNINNPPPPVDPQEKFNAIENYVRYKYINPEKFNYTIYMNQNHADTVQAELGLSSLPIISTYKTPLTVVIDNSYVDFDFDVFGATK